MAPCGAFWYLFWLCFVLALIANDCAKDGTKQLYSDLLAEIRKKEQDELSGDGSNALGGAFSKAFGNMEELLGPECHLLQHLTGASLEKLVAELGAMKSLGACYKDLAKQIASVDKSLAGLDQVNQAVKMEECAKLLLACQSGSVANQFYSLHFYRFTVLQFYNPNIIQESLSSNAFSRLHFFGVGWGFCKSSLSPLYSHES